MTGVAVDEGRCVGCRICELACSFSRRDCFDPEAAAIRITFLDDGGLAVTVGEGCTKCRRPLCAEFCPVGAIQTAEG